MARNIFSRQQYKLVHERGFTPEDARRIAYVQQQRNGNLNPHSFVLNEQGKQYSNLSSEQRDYIRKHKGKLT